MADTKNIIKTEAVSPRSHGLDLWTDAEILGAMLEDQLAAVAALRPALPALAAAAAAAVPRLRAGGRLAYTGAGTSGRIGLQDGVELPPTFSWPRDRLVFLLAGGEAALIRAIEGAEDDEEAATRAIADQRIGPDDVVLAAAASGVTPFTRAALRTARAAGALTIGIANNPGTPLLVEAEHPILLETGREIIGGSTRMKAGTAQKVAFNLFSSLVMIRLGRVHDGYMVDLQATNAKLQRRARKILVDLGGVDERTAEAALAACSGRLKPALLVLKGQSPETAEWLLEQTDGSLRRALALLER